MVTTLILFCFLLLAFAAVSLKNAAGILNQTCYIELFVEEKNEEKQDENPNKIKSDDSDNWHALELR